MPAAKPAFVSKTIIVNTLSLAAALIAAAAGSELVAQYPRASAACAAALAGVNILLRFITTLPLTW